MEISATLRVLYAGALKGALLFLPAIRRTLMKKLLVGLLTAACAVSAVFGLTACGDGKDGADGKDGLNGTDGKDGVGISKTEINADGELVITLSDGTVKNLGVVVGADGNDGNDGNDGSNGKNGTDGLGIKEVKFNEDGSMVVVFTDDSTKDLGKIPYCKHSFSEWETQTEATCTSIGYSTHECDICGYVEYKFEEAKGHEWDEGITFSDRILKTCKICSASQLSVKPTVELPPAPEAPDVLFVLPIDNGVIFKDYGFHYDNLYGATVHKGFDFSADEGTSVKAVLGGTVKEVVDDNMLNENYVTVEHADGRLTTYKYIVPSTGLQVGDTVSQGDVIGTVAPAAGGEMKYGAHLHFELEVDGVTVDPVNCFNSDDLVFADE